MSADGVYFGTTRLRTTWQHVTLPTAETQVHQDFRSQTAGVNLIHRSWESTKIELTEGDDMRMRMANLPGAVSLLVVFAGLALSAAPVQADTSEPRVSATTDTPLLEYPVDEFSNHPAYSSYLEHGDFERYLSEIPDSYDSVVADVLRNSSGALLEDAMESAAKEGVPLEQKLADIDAKEVLSEVVHRLEIQLGDGFGGFWFAGSPTTANFALVGDNAESRKLVEHEFAAVGEAGRLVFHRRELPYDATIDLLTKTVNQLKDMGHSLDAEATPVTGLITLYGPSGDLERIEGDLDTLGLSDLERRQIILIEADLAKPGVGGVGGTLLPIGDPYCSSSFVVRNKYNLAIAGPMSAGHCPNNNFISTEVRPLTGSAYDLDLDFQNGIYSERWDVQWYRFLGSDVVPLPWFTYKLDVDFQYSGKMEMRQVSNVRPRSTQYIGRDICSFGYRDFRDCGEVAVRDHCPNYVASCEALFMKSDFSSGREGSSGGSVYYGTGAWGVISGRHNGDLIYMAANFSGALGTAIWKIP